MRLEYIKRHLGNSTCDIQSHLIRSQQRNQLEIEI